LLLKNLGFTKRCYDFRSLQTKTEKSNIDETNSFFSVLIISRPNQYFAKETDANFIKIKAKLK
jgi:hypothetical protein